MSPTLIAVLAVAASLMAWMWLFVRMRRAEFWEFQVRAFEAADKAHPPPAGAIVFTGSSSIRLWTTLGRDMAPLPVINRGIGGSHLSHIVHYAARVILPYRPRAVVVYAGENDLGWTSPKTPETVLADFQRLVALVHAALPAARIYFLALKLSPFRRPRWGAMRRANVLIEESARRRERVTFVDTCGPLLGPNGRPRPEYMPWYRLHMTAKGYALWTSILKPIIERDLGLGQPAGTEGLRTPVRGAQAMADQQSRGGKKAGQGRDRPSDQQ